MRLSSAPRGSVSSQATVAFDEPLKNVEIAAIHLQGQVIEQDFVDAPYERITSKRTIITGGRLSCLRKLASMFVHEVGKFCPPA